MGTNPDQMTKDSVVQVSFESHFLDLNQKILKRQEGQWKARQLKTLKTALYIKGHLGLYVKQNGFGYDFFRVEKGDPIYEMNVLEFYHDDVCAQLMAAEPKIEAVPLVTDDAERRRATKGMNLIRDRVDQIIFSEEHRQQLAKEGQITGQWTIEQFYDPTRDDGIEWHEQWATAQHPAMQYNECVDCGATCDPDASQCPDPNCGSSNLLQCEIPGMESQYLTDQGWKKKGEIVGRPRSLWSQRFSMTTGPRLSPYRYVEMDLPKEQVEALFGKLQTTASDNWKDEWMHGERVLRRAEAYASGQAAIDNDDASLLQEFYYEPEMLCFVAPDQDYQMMDGRILKKGIRLSDQFSKGMVLTTQPGLNKFLTVRDESHRDRFQDGLFNCVAGEKIGRGIDAAAEYQRQSTVVHSMMYNHVRETARPLLFISDKLAANPNIFQRRIIPVPQSVLQDKDVSRLFDVLQMPQISNAAPYLMEKLQEGMQRATKSFNSPGSVVSGYSNTATGDQIASAKQSGIHVPFLANFAQFKRGVIARFAELAFENYDSKRMLTVLDGKRSSRVARELEMADVRGYEWLWTIKPGSIASDTPIERKQNLEGALNAFTIAAKIGKDTPEVRRQICEIYDVDLFNEHQDERIDRCLDAMELMKQDYAQGLLDPQALYMLAPVDPYETGAESRINFWRDTLASEEGHQLPMEIRTAIHLHIDANFAAVVNERAYMAQAASIGSGLLAPFAPGINLNPTNAGEQAPDGNPSPVEQSALDQQQDAQQAQQQGAQNNGKTAKKQQAGAGAGAGFAGFPAFPGGGGGSAGAGAGQFG